MEQAPVMPNATPLTVTRQTCFTQDTGLRLAAMLDLPFPLPTSGMLVPNGWHFPLIGAETARNDLRPDGFPGLGLPLPASALPRLVAGGRSVTFHSQLLVDGPMLRTSTVSAIKHKDTSGGPLSILTMSHSLRAADNAETVLEESQTYLLLSSRHVEREDGEAAPDMAPLLSKIVTPDDTLLFQFSALSFNSHKIHLDRAYARDVEGFPDLVVNGGLTTLLMTEMVRVDLGLTIKAITVTNKRPLFVNRPITLSAFTAENGVKIVALDDRLRIAAEMEVITHEL
jgi:3-methylfumaryl-CoA hydratase